MVLKDYKIDGEYISISKKELENYMSHYSHLADKQTELFMKMFYAAKFDVLLDIVRLFEPLEG